jgi:hypothetical protein
MAETTDPDWVQFGPDLALLDQLVQSIQVDQP